MPNKPRPENRHRMVRVEDDLWREAGEACRELGTNRSEVMREALRLLVAGVDSQQQTLIQPVQTCAVSTQSERKSGV